MKKQTRQIIIISSMLSIALFAIFASLIVSFQSNWAKIQIGDDYNQAINIIGQPVFVSHVSYFGSDIPYTRSHWTNWIFTCHMDYYYSNEKQIEIITSKEKRVKYWNEYLIPLLEIKRQLKENVDNSDLYI